MGFSPSLRNPPAGPRITKSLLTPFGVELRKLRIEKGMRLADLAKDLEYSPSYISAFETGRRNIPDEVVDKLGIHFELSEFEIAKLRRAAESSRTEVVLHPNSPDQLALAIEIEKKLKALSTDRIRELVKHVQKFFHSHERACRIDFAVKKMQRRALSDRARKFRDAFVKEKKKFPVEMVLELALPLCIPEFAFIVTPDEEMDGMTGKACLNPPYIEVSASIYDEAIRGESRGRWILAHEMGHLLLAHGHGMRGQLIPAKTQLPKAISAEWQADEFAGELLMPAAECSQMSIEEITLVFGVSEQLATDRLNFISKNGSEVAKPAVG